MSKLVTAAAVLVLANIGAADAHPFHTDGEGHALFGIEIALALAAAGLWAIQLAPRAVRAIGRKH